MRKLKQLLLWPGWGMPAISWSKLALPLAAQHQIAAQAQTLPTCEEMAANADYTPDVLVDTLLAHTTAPITLCGWSLGALLAMHAAHRHPDKIEKLILIGATPCFLQAQDWPHGLPSSVLNEFTAAVHDNSHAALMHFIALLNQGDVHARLITRQLTDIVKNIGIHSTTTLLAGLQLLRDMDVRPLTPHIRQPCLLLHGGHDALMPPSAAVWLSETLPHAQLNILPHAAHAPFLSDPVSCALSIADFIHA